LHTNTIQKNTEPLLEFRNNFGLKIKVEKHEFMSGRQYAGQNHNINIVNIFFEKVAKVKYLGMTATNQNDVHDEIKSRLYSGNACCR